MKFLKVYFGEITNGKLTRIQFLIYNIFSFIWLFLSPFIILFITFLLSKYGNSLNAEMVLIYFPKIRSINDLMLLEDFLLILFSLIYTLIFAPFLFAIYNLMAKRFRDIGWDGWNVIFIITILELLLPYPFSGFVDMVIFVLFFILHLYPSNKGEELSILIWKSTKILGLLFLILIVISVIRELITGS